VAGRKADVTKTGLTQEERDAKAEVVNAELPAEGHAKREAQKAMQYTLEQQAEMMAGQMMAGTVDPAALEIANEIASRVQYLDVTGQQADRVYKWASISRGSNGQHVQRAKISGWEVVQGNDPEARELLNTDGSTTRCLGDLLLMWMPRDRWVVMKAQSIVRQRRRDGASAAGLIELAHQYRDKGFMVRPHGMESLEGPAIENDRFSRNPAATQMIDAGLRKGNLGLNKQIG
jgi:hypothetical protein